MQIINMSQPFQTAIPIVEKLDPYQFFIAYKLFRDATRSVNGTPVKVRLLALKRALQHYLTVDLLPKLRTYRTATVTYQKLFSWMHTQNTSPLSPKMPSSYQNGLEIPRTRVWLL